MIKKKGNKTYKCTDCTAIFIFDPMDNDTTLSFCPKCGGFNSNEDTVDVFGGDKIIDNKVCGECDNTTGLMYSNSNGECLYSRCFHINHPAKYHEDFQTNKTSCTRS